MTSSVSSTDKKPDPLYVYKKFKKEMSEESQCYEKHEPNKPVKKPNVTKPEADNTGSMDYSSSSYRHLNTDSMDYSSRSSRNLNADSMDYSSSSSRDLGKLVKKTLLQEKIFNCQMQAHHKKKLHDSSSGSDSFTNSSDDRHRSFLNSNMYDNGNNERVNMNGILHLKKPMVVNLDDHDTFCEERGKMQPIPWANFSSKSNSQEKQADKKKEPEIQNKTMRSTAKSKPLISEEFSNFVERSVASRAAYDIEGNTERDVNYIDCPLYRIQQLTNKKNLDTIRIPASVRTSFSPKSSSNHLFNKIDTFGVLDQTKNLNSRSTKTENLDQKAGSYNRNDLAQNRSSANGKLDQKSKSNCRSRIVQSSSSGCKNQLKENFDLFNNAMPADDEKCVQMEKENKEVKTEKEAAGDDVMTFVNLLSSEENIAKKKASRKALEIEDDQFVFVRNSPNLSSEISSVPLPASKISHHKYPFDRLKAVCRETKTTIKPLIKADPLKHMTKIQVKTKSKYANETLDSDDTFNISSNLGSSVSVASTRDRCRAYRKKKLESTLSNNNENSIILPDQNDDSKVLENKNQLLNRCLRASYDYSKVHDDNVVEITNVKIGPKPQPLLTAISTRYFAKSSTDSQKPANNDNNNGIGEAEHIKDNDEIGKTEHRTPSLRGHSTTKVMNSTLLNNLQEEKCVDLSIKINASIENISSISAMSVEETDSASLTTSIETIETSLVKPSTNKDKVDLRSKNSENRDVSKNEYLTETINISENFKSSTQSENQQSKITSEITENWDAESEMMKNKCKFEAVSSSDCKNELMNCEEVIDYENFDIENFDMENIDLWFPGINSKVDSIKKQFSDVPTNNNEMTIDNCSNDICSSLSNDNGSSSDASVSSNANSENSSSSHSLFDFSSVFKKVDIKLSELKTSGLYYDGSLPKKNERTNQKVPNKSDHKVDNKNKNHQVDHHSNQSKTTSVSKEKLCNRQDEGKENTEQNLNNICDLSSQNSEKPKIINGSVAITPKTASKKMQKYRNTLNKYKDKSKAEVDTKEDNNVQQPDDLSTSLQRRQILKEIQKHKLHLSVKQFV